MSHILKIDKIKTSKDWKNIKLLNDIEKKEIPVKKPVANIIFAKAGVWCFNESEVLNSNFVLLMKFGAKNPRLRKYEKRCGAL